MKLKSFLADSHKSRSREYILTTRLIHDLTVAAAALGYDLLVYLPTVDSDGFDVILDDRDRLVPIQLKSVIDVGKACGWKIRRTLIRPPAEVAVRYGFEQSPNGAGRGGGVILTKVGASTDTTVEVRYEYSDIDVLSAMWLDSIRRTPVQKERLRRLRAELESNPDGSVELPRCAFLPATSPEHLLALVGLHSRVDQPWRLQLKKLLGALNLGEQLTIPEETLRKNVQQYLESFSPKIE